VSEFPQGWARATIGEVTQTVPTVNPRADLECEFTYVDISSIDNTAQAIAAPKVLHGSKAPSRARQLLRSGDTVFSTVRTYLRNIGYVDATLDGAVGSTGFAVLRPVPGISSRYLYYHALTDRFVDGLTAVMRGTSYPAVVDSQVRNMPIAIAPTSEQERIVAVIEEQLSRLDAGVAALKRARRNLKRMRTAALDAACAGRLVRGEETTSTRRIVEVIKSLDQGWSPRCERIPASDGEWGVIKTSAIQAMRFDDSANKRLPSTLEPRQGLEILPGDLLITRAGPRARAGVCCLVRDTRQRLMICDKVYRFRPDLEAVLPEYLELVLNAPATISAIDHIKTGISDSGVNITQATFGALEVPVPSIATQTDIVRAVDEQLARISEVEADIEVAGVRGRQLRSSVLSAAFSGKLVPQDVNDEPATVLLERMVVDRAPTNGNKSAKVPRRRAKTTA
jgi:type I restriction enzyme S subunit